MRRSGWILIALLATSFILMLATSMRDSAIVDELAHIPAGYAYDHYLDYRLNPEHPPAVKALAALPLQFMPLKFPISNDFWTMQVNGEWGVGGAFLYGLGNNADTIVQWARLFPMLITLGLIVFAYFWARKLYGKAWALLPAAMLALSPIILSEGHYVTTDVGAALGIIIGLYTFSKYVSSPSTKNLFIAGIGFGIAEVTKFSAIILIPLYAALMFFYYIASRMRARQARRGQAAYAAAATRPIKTPNIWRLLLIYIIGALIVIYPLYAIFTAHYDPARETSDTTAIIGTLASMQCSPTESLPCLAKLNIAMTKNALTRPAAVGLLGILMVFERVSGRNISYFLGSVYDFGTPLYFPVIYILKETLPVLMLLLATLTLVVWCMLHSIFRRRMNLHGYILDKFPQFTMIIFIIVYWIVSIGSQLNIGVRHLLPVIPPSYILATGGLKSMRLGTHSALIKKFFVGAALLWLAIETALAFPYYLSYFNELGGGTANGYKYVTDSNYDWGQDMIALQMWMNSHPEVDKLALDFFGASNPAYYFGSRYVPWQSSDGNPAATGIHWFAVSINNLQDAIQPLAAGSIRAPDADYSWLTQAVPREPGLGGIPKPYARVGTTIFIYRL